MSILTPLCGQAADPSECRKRSVNCLLRKRKMEAVGLVETSNQSSQILNAKSVVIWNAAEQLDCPGNFI